VLAGEAWRGGRGGLGWGLCRWVGVWYQGTRFFGGSCISWLGVYVFDLALVGILSNTVCFDIRAKASVN